MTTAKPIRSRLWRAMWITMAMVAVLAVATVVAFKCSPWPSVLAIRWMFGRSSVAVEAALSAHAPAGIRTSADIRYDPNDADAWLDIYRPSALDDRPLPVVVWIHGGGYVAGNRKDMASYARILASDGYAVVALDYSLAPAARYPVPVQQINRALTFLSDNAEPLQLDRNHFILGGDSAGAQLAAQLAALISSPDYAQVMGLHAGISRPQLRGVVLFCGPHDGRLIASQGASDWFTHTVMWSYFGSPSPPSSVLETFSVVPHVTSAFPPAFITAGNSDALEPQSIALADALQRQGVRVETLFYPASHMPSLDHEYQFDLSLPESRDALNRTQSFLRSVVANEDEERRVVSPH